jgi:hypothetical protein
MEKFNKESRGSCPNCGDEDPDWDGKPHVIDEYVEFYGECHKCGKKIKEVYEIDYMYSSYEE